MSVQTSSANVDPPPLLFGQRSPSPPPFSSPPLSPNHIHAPQSPLAVPNSHMDNETDVDMSASVTIPQANGQNHDRDGDTQMDGVDDSAASPGGGESFADDDSDSSSDDSTVPARTHPMDLVGMPAGTGEAQRPNALSDPVLNASSPPQPSSPPQENGAPANGLDTGALPPPLHRTAESAAPSDIPPPPQLDNSQHPPPIPVPPLVSDGSRMNEDSSSDEEDDGAFRWHPIQEDTSTPDERELKEMEGLPDVSALDHAHWEKKTFSELDDPEYIARESGRIEWTITNYNGTKTKPNKELVMKSPIVRIGGYDWRIKFYPRGNDSDYLSIYIENLTVARKKDAPASNQEAPASESTSNDTAPLAQPNSEEAATVELQKTPLPLLNTEPIPKRKSVAAQASVVLYNPSEPRVNYYRSCLHRFCPDSPDWGWTRYHGPYYEIQHRHRGQRQALLKNDTLAFTAYIRVVDDDTGCLWEHDSRDNPWDSFAMTGLQGLAVPEHAPGGNLISAVSSWLLVKPFRELLYRLDIPTFDQKPFEKPKVLTAAFQKVLYMMRTQVHPKDGPVGLEDITDALDYYGMDSRIEKQDVVEIWDNLRTKLEEELAGTGLESVLLDLLGPRRDFSTGVPSYLVPVQNCTSVQEAINKADSMLHPAQSPPRILAVELQRQAFDESSRCWKKLVNKVSLDENIIVKDVSYTLYGFVAHKDHLQSGNFYSVLRPCGPGGKWYSFRDGKDENKVVCITDRQAIEHHEGIAGTPSSRDSGASVAYVVMYLRDDASNSGFTSFDTEEPWKASESIVDEVSRAKDVEVFVPDRLPLEPKPPSKWKDPKNDRTIDFKVFDSRVFNEHEGPGIIDFFHPRWHPDARSEHVYDVKLNASDTIDTIRRKVAAAAKIDTRQCKMWFIDSSPQGQSATEGSPHLVSTGPLEFPNAVLGGHEETFYLGEFKEHCSESRIWLHILDEKDLGPILPRNISLGSDSPYTSQNSQSNVHHSGTGDAAVPNAIASEDTPMSEPDDATPPEPNMGEVVIPVVPPGIDTEMGGTQGLIPPPPPPAFGLVDPTPPPPPPPAVIPAYHDEVYFFLKFFDAEAQKLVPRGSYLTKKSENILPLVLKELGLPPDASMDLFEEEDLVTANPIGRARRSFAQNDLQNRCIIIAAKPLTDAQKASLAARAAFADPQSYLEFYSKQRNFPHMGTGHFQFSYFANPLYEGSLRNHHPHGHGKFIYFSGDVYVGTFQLGKRHGHGLMTYANNNTYDGEWEHDLKNGQGTFTEHETGNSYTGGWKQDKKFGEGITRWKVAQETERLCRVCWDESAEAAFYDCGHVVACLGCARGVDVCPVCRKRVLGAMKLYFV